MSAGREKAAGRRGRASVRRLLPNLLTTVSLCSGLASLDFSIRGEWGAAIVAIAFAALFDALDGLAARLLKAQSRFGEVLDSLSDFLSFGVAPAALLHLWLLKGADVFGLAAAMTYALCAALRLARFTAEASARPLPAPGQKAKPSRYFTGMPSPAAAGAALVPPMIELSPIIKWSPPQWLVVVYTFAIGLLMISRLPMFSIKAVRVRRSLRLFVLVGVGLLVAVARRDFFLAGVIVAGGYLLTLPLSVWMKTRERRLENGGTGGADGDGAGGSARSM